MTGQIMCLFVRPIPQKLMRNSTCVLEPHVTSKIANGAMCVRKIFSKNRNDWAQWWAV